MPDDQTSTSASSNSKREESRDVSLTLSPLHLIAPIAELTAEFRALDGLGLALIAGAGSITVNDPNSSIDGDSVTAYELGAQVVYYPLEGFESLQLGAELLWLRVSSDNLGSESVSGLGEGVGIGPLIGYKLITNGGFTFFVQGGFQYLAMRASASDGQGTTAQAEDSTIIPLLNANLGWSL